MFILSSPSCPVRPPLLLRRQLVLRRVLGLCLAWWSVAWLLLLLLLLLLGAPSALAQNTVSLFNCENCVKTRQSRFPTSAAPLSVSCNNCVCGPRQDGPAGDRQYPIYSRLCCSGSATCADQCPSFSAHQCNAVCGCTCSFVVSDVKFFQFLLVGWSGLNQGTQPGKLSSSFATNLGVASGQCNGCDGKFGGGTETEVFTFQTRMGISVDSDVASQTLLALWQFAGQDDQCGPVNSRPQLFPALQPPQMETNSTGWHIHAYKWLLSTRRYLGNSWSDTSPPSRLFFQGQVNQNWDSTFAQAVLDFQEALDLTPYGAVTNETFKAMVTGCHGECPYSRAEMNALCASEPRCGCVQLHPKCGQWRCPQPSAAALCSPAGQPQRCNSVQVDSCSIPCPACTNGLVCNATGFCQCPVVGTKPAECQNKCGLITYPTGSQCTYDCGNQNCQTGLVCSGDSCICNPNDPSARAAACGQRNCGQVTVNGCTFQCGTCALANQYCAPNQTCTNFTCTPIGDPCAVNGAQPLCGNVTQVGPPACNFQCGNCSSWPGMFCNSGVAQPRCDCITNTQQAQNAVCERHLTFPRCTSVNGGSTGKTCSVDCGACPQQQTCVNGRCQCAVNPTADFCPSTDPCGTKSANGCQFNCGTCGTARVCNQTANRCVCDPGYQNTICQGKQCGQPTAPGDGEQLSVPVWRMSDTSHLSGRPVSMRPGVQQHGMPGRQVRSGHCLRPIQSESVRLSADEL